MITNQPTIAAQHPAATTRALHVTAAADLRIAATSCHPRTVRPRNFTGFTALPIARAPAGSENAI